MHNTKIIAITKQEEVLLLLAKAKDNRHDTRSKRSLIDEAIGLIKRQWKAPVQREDIVVDLRAWSKDDIVPSDLQLLCDISADIIEEITKP